jgi:hypothetical protein
MQQLENMASAFLLPIPFSKVTSTRRSIFMSSGNTPAATHSVRCSRRKEVKDFIVLASVEVSNEKLKRTCPSICEEEAGDLRGLWIPSNSRNGSLLIKLLIILQELPLLCSIVSR